MEWKCSDIRMYLNVNSDCTYMLYIKGVLHYNVFVTWIFPTNGYQGENVKEASEPFNCLLFEFGNQT